MIDSGNLPLGFYQGDSVVMEDTVKHSFANDFSFPPEPIDDLSAQLHGGAKSYWGNIHLSWSESNDYFGIDHYVIYRSTEPYLLGDSVGVTTDTTYLDAGAVGNPNTNYYYNVKAIDLAGNKSPTSNQVGEFDRPWGVKGGE